MEGANVRSAPEGGHLVECIDCRVRRSSTGASAATTTPTLEVVSSALHLSRAARPRSRHHELPEVLDRTRGPKGCVDAA
jgi:hypothetical protein